MARLLLITIMVAFIGQFMMSPSVLTPEQTAPDALAGNLLIYHQSALNYLIAHPTYTGTIPQASITFPNWYSVAGSWVSVVGTSKVLVTYNNGSLPVLAAWLSNYLNKYSGSDIGVGVTTSAGTIVPALMEPTTLVPTPAGVPVGVVVAYSQIG